MPIDSIPEASPIKFLDPYGPEDSEVFFGRSREIDELYAKLYASPITVIYGESGTGKTSLIQCGLRSRIPPEDMLFVQVRSGSTPDEALRQALRIAAPYIPEEQGQSLSEYLRLVIRRSYKTVLLVFDPFEEFLIPKAGESLKECSARLKVFAKQLAEWLEESLNLRMLFAVRQEFLAHLTELEEALPALYENRLWLQRMSRERAKEIISGLRKKANIGITPGLARSLLDATNKIGQGVDLPTLQVVLYELYNQAKPHSSDNSIELSEDDYRDLGEVSNILGRFVDGRIKNLNQDAGIAKQILKTLATPQSTRCSLTLNEIANKITPPLEPEYLNELLNTLVRQRILREDPDRCSFELSHDALAAHVRGWMSEPEKALETIRQSLNWRFGEYQNQKLRLLDAKFMEELKSYETSLNLQGEMAAFVKRSKENLEEDQKRRRKQRRKKIAATSILSITVLTIAVYLLLQLGVTKRNQGEAINDYHQARKTIHEILIIIRTDKRNNPTKLNPAYENLLKYTVKYYQTNPSHHAQDTELKKDLAEARAIAGELLSGEEAKTFTQQAMNDYNSLKDQYKNNQEYDFKLAKCQIRMGHILHSQHQADNTKWIKQAENDYSNYLNSLNENTSIDSIELFNLGDAYTDLGMLEELENDLAKAEVSLNQSIILYKRARALNKDINNHEYQYALAYSLHKRANILKLLRYKNRQDMREDDLTSPLKTDNPDDLYLEAITLIDNLIKSDGRPAFQRSLALIYHDKGDFNQEIGNKKQALEAYHQAAEWYKKFHQENPLSIETLKPFQEVENRLIVLRLINRQPKEAVTESEQALEINRQSLQLIAKHAHSLLLSHHRREAWEEYKANKYKNDLSGKPFRQIVEDDFRELKSNGISDPEMAKVLSFLKNDHL